MKTSTRAMGTSLLFLCGLLVNQSAMAQHRGHAYGHGPTVRFGFYYGFPIYAPRYFPVPIYAYPGYTFAAPVQVFPPAIISYSSPPVYIERGGVPIEPAAPVQNGQSSWNGSSPAAATAESGAGAAGQGGAGGAGIRPRNAAARDGC